MEIWSVLFYRIFCFKQKTAYEMRISDWSSDVCSSDLYTLYLARSFLVPIFVALFLATLLRPFVSRLARLRLPDPIAAAIVVPLFLRSEERRVGKECVSKCRSRWSP